MSAGDALGAALAAENAAIYAYGVLGVQLESDDEKSDAHTAETAHRQRRNYVVTRLDELKVKAPATPAGYDLPFPVTDRDSALKLAIHVEDGVAQAWRPVLPVTGSADRTTALSALTDAAVRATRWRRRASADPLTLPFPGRAG
ncbi:ferritin-like domain-containing protein [Actinoplanes sp. NPDC051343]|jgi:ferritin-like protein|uniref:ferritin-like domain-containing protein n=1 Tax=Actinoplanes sp. NPDC051343 TaxID=3363906 RepID=UPI0037898F17